MSCTHEEMPLPIWEGVFRLPFQAHSSPALRKFHLHRTGIFAILIASIIHQNITNR